MVRRGEVVEGVVVRGGEVVKGKSVEKRLA